MDKEITMKPLVTVIIPVHNAERTLDQCIKSVVNQTYKNLEIICCNDCSTDKSEELLAKWKERDSRIIVLRNATNMFVAYTRNRCIEIATGKYIAQIDDDDYCAKDRIERQVKFLEENKDIDFLGTGMFLFDDSGIWGDTGELKGFIVKKQQFLFNSPFHNPSMMYRTEIIKSVNGYRISRETKRGEDYDMHMRMYVEGYSGYVLPDKLTYYRFGKESFSKSKFIYRINEAIIRYKNFRKLKLFPIGYIYVIKPLILGLIPIDLLNIIKRNKKIYR